MSYQRSRWEKVGEGRQRGRWGGWGREAGREREGGRERRVGGILREGEREAETGNEKSATLSGILELNLPCLAASDHRFFFPPF